VVTNDENAAVTDRGATEEKIIEAATVEFANYGVKGARMQAIADTAGVNKALLHYYFRSKQLLFETVFQMFANRFFARLRKEMEKLPEQYGLKEMIQLFVRGHIMTIKANPLFPRLIAPNIFHFFELFENIPEKVVKTNGDVIRKILDALEQEKRSGRIKQVHPVQFFMNVLGMSVATFIGQPIVETVYKKVLNQTFEFDDAFYEERIRIIVDTAYNGLMNKEQIS